MQTKILDTNVILERSLTSIIREQEEGTRICIPFQVIRELDKFKCGEDLIHYNARASIKFLSQFLLNDLATDAQDRENPLSGKEFEKRIVQISLTEKDREYIQNNAKVDFTIITLAMEKIAKGEEAEIITEDLHLCVIAYLMNIKAGIYNINQLTYDTLYTGKTTIQITDKQVDTWCSKKQLRIKDKLLANQIVKMIDSQGNAHYGIYREQEDLILPFKNTYEAWGVKPKKDKSKKVLQDQLMLMDLLLDPEIELITVCGKAGTGKTFLALAAALEQTLGSKAKYNRILITRPLKNLDKDIGALPGTEMEKVFPWLGGAADNLEVLFDRQKPVMKDMSPQSSSEEIIMNLVADGIVKFTSMNFIRGRSISNQFIIIDESQCLSIDQAVSLATRVGEGSKIIFLGDISFEQIDDKKLSPLNNGLTFLSERLKGVSHKIAHITFDKDDNNIVRSDIASLAVKYLQRKG